MRNEEQEDPFEEINLLGIDRLVELELKSKKAKGKIKK